MKTMILAFAAALMLTVQLQAQTQPQAPNNNQPYSPYDTTVTPYYSGDTDSSKALRANKRFQITAYLFGAGPSIASSQGLSFGYFFDADKMLLIEGMSGNLSSSTQTSSGFTWQNLSKYEVQAKSFGVHYKQFVGNSFYYRAGVDYRTLSYEYQYIPNDERSSFNGDSVALNFQIGNQWQWDNFTLGCDWVGMSLPITSEVKDKKLNAAAQADANFHNNRIEDDSNQLVKQSHLNLLRFYLGMSF